MEPTLKALVVDDSKVMRMMVIRALGRIREVKWNFFEAADGMEAMNLVRVHPLDIGFIDWNMPQMSGIELVHLIRMEASATMPLVMVTSEKTVARIEEALREGVANAYICKPFSDEEVAQKIGGILQQIKVAKQKKSFFASV